MTLGLIDDVYVCPRGHRTAASKVRGRPRQVISCPERVYARTECSELARLTTSGRDEGGPAPSSSAGAVPARPTTPDEVAPGPRTTAGDATPRGPREGAIPRPAPDAAPWTNGAANQGGDAAPDVKATGTADPVRNREARR